MVYEIEAEPIAEGATEETITEQEPVDFDLAQGNDLNSQYCDCCRKFQWQGQPPKGWTVVWEPSPQ
uniref:Uncharacterized protein n=1 Tax=Arundo donax TaxID=35708 RepID=A0A0A9EDB8_ARUDO